MKEIQQAVRGYRIPLYMEEILTHNYCPHFLRMSMVREKDQYKFCYSADRYNRLNTEILNTYQKLVLLRTIMNLNERNMDWLIGPENYLIEPELIYSLNNCVDDGCVRLLFYPDLNRISFDNKLVHLSERIRNNKDSMESDIFDRFRAIAETGDRNRTRLFLDKHILRMEAERRMPM